MVINCYPGYFEPRPACLAIHHLLRHNGSALIAVVGKFPRVQPPPRAGITGHVVVITDPWIRLLTNDGLHEDRLLLSLNPWITRRARDDYLLKKMSRHFVRFGD